MSDKAQNFYKKLLLKEIILRSTEDGYKLNMLRLTIGSRTDSLVIAAEEIFKWWKKYLSLDVVY